MLLTKFLNIPLPGPIQTIHSFFILLFSKEPVTNSTLIEHTVASLLRVSIGAIIAFCFAIPLGIFIGKYEKIGTFFETIFEFLRPIPPLAWVPISIILFGNFGPIFVVFTGAFFPVLLNTIDSVRNINPRFMDLAKIFEATEKQKIIKIIIPASIPSIITGIRIGLGVGWMCIIAAEMISLSGIGLGYFILVMYQVGHWSEMISGMIMIGIVGYLMNELLVKFSKGVIYDKNN
jgi:NitT/TauT family transport system permease protein